MTISATLTLRYMGRGQQLVDGTPNMGVDYAEPAEQLACVGRTTDRVIEYYSSDIGGLRELHDTGDFGEC